ncbi:ADP-ribosylation/crystallin J1 [Hymenobacter terrestris]|uniref:ADP-ribosylation/crystallin J1 n=1 Tax=Hymenobacter terrestris TaxID=2748310 RepID=A0ABX2Q3U2_9BACT|nr:ADP-ribosylation/crystallin J1 [Hymenobacter terrestris]NVO85483.1 ADP-ribosylation/crystallin J1 [Hymenobacter terrestris]
MRHDPATVLLYRPVTQAELDWIAASDWLAFPLAQPEPLVFYLTPPESVTGLAGADSSYLLRFALFADYAAQLPVEQVGSREPDALLVPAEELAEFNRQLVGRIEVISIFGAG